MAEGSAISSPASSDSDKDQVIKEKDVIIKSLEEKIQILEQAAPRSVDSGDSVAKDLEQLRLESNLLKEGCDAKDLEIEELRKELEALKEKVEEQNLRLASRMTIGGRDVEEVIEEKNKMIKSLEDELSRLEREHEDALQQMDGIVPSKQDGEEAAEDSGEIPYDVLDRLDEELETAKRDLALAKQELAERDRDLKLCKASEESLRERLAQATPWQQRAQDLEQHAAQAKAEAARKERELEEERQIRRTVEARYEEKLKLKVKDAEGLSAEVTRLRKGGEQLNAVLAELEHVRADGRQKLEAKEREIQHLEGALAAAEGERQKAAARVAAVEAEMTQLDARVRNAEEVRWRAGMDLAKAKAEMDWRFKADQEKDFFMERMKEELDRVKNKLMRSEMRKLKLEESLEEALAELRGKKREIEQVKARVEGLVRLLQVQQGGSGLDLQIDRDRSRMLEELYPR